MRGAVGSALLEACTGSGGVIPECLGERWQIHFDDVADGGDIDSEVLVDEDIPESADLRPGDLRVGVGEFRREMVRRFPDDL